MTVLSMKRTPFFSAARRTFSVTSRSTRIMAVHGPVGMTMNLPFTLGRLAPHSNSLSSK